jgi:hypothetical protein
MTHEQQVALVEEARAARQTEQVREPNSAAPPGDSPGKRSLSGPML